MIPIRFDKSQKTKSLNESGMSSQNDVSNLDLAF